MNRLFIGQDSTQSGITLSNLLVVGRSGSGRFNFINRYLSNLTHSYQLEDLRIILVDPKASLYSDYSELPQLMFDGVISQADKFYQVLSWLDTEIDSRLNNPSEKMTSIVVIIDELADFIINDPDKKLFVENLFKKISDNSDQVNIYLLTSTSRVDKVILTDNLLLCFQWRLAFGLNTDSESFLVINEPGAEKLKMPGNCLLKNMESEETINLKIPLISEAEISAHKLSNF